MPNTIYETQLQSFKKLKQGKVRDIYELDEKHLLIVATDRISAFDVVLPTPIPHKGMVLTEISNFWFEYFSNSIPNHLSQKTVDEIGAASEEHEQIRGRSVVVEKTQPIPLEAVVRGYLIGSGWEDYKNHQAICGIKLPRGLKLAQQLPNPIFTPSTKAAPGFHDENISTQEARNLIGSELFGAIKEYSLQIYTKAYEYARKKGVIIADTKFEFGLNTDNELILIDEVLTPDSSRFWAQDLYQIGKSPVSYDKQFVRDYLEGLDWKKQPPGPNLPEEIVAKTSEKYQAVKDLLIV